MKKIQSIGFIGLLLLCLSSCIDFTEKIHFNKDGSGNYLFQIDTKELVSFIDALGAENRGDRGDKTLQEFTGYINNLGTVLKQVAGISNIEVASDTSGYHTTVSFEFQDLQALNQGMEMLYAKVPQSENTAPFFSVRKKRLIRSDRDPLTAMLKKGPFERKEMDMSVLLLKDATVESRISFEGRVKKYSNAEYKQRADGSLQWVKYVFSQRDADISIANTIDLKGMKFRKTK